MDELTKKHITILIAVISYVFSIITYSFTFMLFSLIVCIIITVSTGYNYSHNKLIAAISLATLTTIMILAPGLDCDTYILQGNIQLSSCNCIGFKKHVPAFDISWDKCVGIPIHAQTITQEEFDHIIHKP